MRDLKVKLGVAKVEDSDSINVLKDLPIAELQANQAVSVMAGDDEVEVLDDTDDAL